MLFNILLLKYNTKILNQKFFNKIFIITSICYTVLFYLFREITLFILVLDSLYFLFKIIKLNNLNSKNLKIPIIKKLQPKSSITSPIVEIIKKHLDPEFESDKYKPYKYDLHDAITEVSNNLS